MLFFPLAWSQLMSKENETSGKVEKEMERDKKSIKNGRAVRERTGVVKSMMGGGGVKDTLMIRIKLR